MKTDKSVGPFQRAARFRALGRRAPKFHFGLRPRNASRGGELVKLPFKRSALFILISGVFLAVFSIPLFTVSGMFNGSGDGSLFSLIFGLFSMFWLLGWSVGVAVLVLVFLFLSLGREVLVIRPGSLFLRVEILGLGLGVEYLGTEIANLRRREAHESKGNSWRGDHLVFDYGGEQVGFGSVIRLAQAESLISRIETVVVGQPAPADWEQRRKAESDRLRSDVETRTAPALPAPIDTGLSALSTRALLVANLIPLLGVLIADWRIGDIMLLFWAESAIIGFYNVLKMWVIGRWSVLFFGPFFIGHYGGFMVGHLLFIYALFQAGFDNPDPAAADVLRDFVGLWPALLGLLVSHGVSYFANFIRGREYAHLTVKDQMSAPYKRIIIMHVTIIFGGFLTMAFDAPVLALVLLIVLKTVVDARSHIKEHSQGMQD